MPISDQKISKDRYMLIPRVLIFVRRGDEVLLIKGAPTKKLWAGKYNGLGGHIERGEDVIECAKRELFEEAGLSADLRLCGNIIVDAGEVGICLFVICGENAKGEIKGSTEGEPEWVKKEALSHLPVVEDLLIILNKIESLNRNEPPFSGRSYYVNGELKIYFSE